jgi:dodecin
VSQPFQSAVDLEAGSRERLQVTELIGTSTESWEDAAATAVRTARETLRDLRVAEVAEQDIHIDGNGGVTYRTSCGSPSSTRELKRG